MLCIPAFFAVVITAVSDFDRGNANSVLFNPQNHSLPFLKKGCTAGSTVMQAFDTDSIILCTIIGEGGRAQYCRVYNNLFLHIVAFHTVINLTLCNNIFLFSKTENFDAQYFGS